MSCVFLGVRVQCVYDLAQLVYLNRERSKATAVASSGYGGERQSIGSQSRWRALGRKERQRKLNAVGGHSGRERGKAPRRRQSIVVGG